MTPEARARILETGCDHAEPGTTLVCRECVGAMLADEREACARIADAHFNAELVAQRIRARP